MVTVPPRHYCTVANPVSRDAQGSVLLDVTGQVRLRHADLEIRLAQDPFPLYPGEVLEKVSVLPPLHHTLPIVPPCPRAPHYLLRGKKNGTTWGGGCGGNISCFSPETELTHCPSTRIPQMPSSSSHDHNRLAPPLQAVCSSHHVISQALRPVGSSWPVWH